MFRCRKDLFIPGEIKAGDIIGFSGDSWISTLVNIATYGIPFWGLSHVGIMGRADDGRLMLFESTQLDGLPCEITGEVFLRARELALVPAQAQVFQRGPGRARALVRVRVPPGQPSSRGSRRKTSTGFWRKTAASTRSSCRKWNRN